MAKEIEDDQEQPISKIWFPIKWVLYLQNYKELKRLAGNRNEWRNCGKLHNQP